MSSSPRTFPTDQAVTYRLEVRDENGTLTDPSGSVNLTLKGADLSAPLVLVPPVIENPSTGIYLFRRAYSAGGRASWKWRTFGDLVGSYHGHDFIDPGDF